MLKKLAAVASTGAVLLAAATPAFATWSWGWHSSGSTVTNSANVVSSANASANSGYNDQSNGTEASSWGWHAGNVAVNEGNSATTGPAVSAAGNNVQVNGYTGCNVCNLNGWSWTTNSANVVSSAAASSNSGYNSQSNWTHASSWGGNVGVVEGNSLVTGRADSASQNWVIVNSTWAP